MATASTAHANATAGDAPAHAIPGAEDFLLAARHEMAARVVALEERLQQANEADSDVIAELMYSYNDLGDLVNLERMRDLAGDYCNVDEEFWESWLASEKERVREATKPTAKSLSHLTPESAEVATTERHGPCIAVDSTAAQKNYSHLLALYRRSISHCPSQTLWLSWLKLKRHIYEEAATIPSDCVIACRAADAYRRAAELAITDLGIHPTDGGALWSAYRKFEVAHLLRLLQSESSIPLEWISEQIEHVKCLFLRQISLPMCNLFEVVSELRLLQTEVPESERIFGESFVEEVEDLYDNYSRTAWNARKPLEHELSQSLSSEVDDVGGSVNGKKNVERLEASWTAYVTFEQTRLQKLLESALGQDGLGTQDRPSITQAEPLETCAPALHAETTHEKSGSQQFQDASQEAPPKKEHPNARLSLFGPPYVFPRSLRFLRDDETAILQLAPVYLPIPGKPLPPILQMPVAFRGHSTVAADGKTMPAVGVPCSESTVNTEKGTAFAQARSSSTATGASLDDTGSEKREDVRLSDPPRGHAFVAHAMPLSPSYEIAREHLAGRRAPNIYFSRNCRVPAAIAEQIYRVFITLMRACDDLGPFRPTAWISFVAFARAAFSALFQVTDHSDKLHAASTVILSPPQSAESSTASGLVQGMREERERTLRWRFERAVRQAVRCQPGSAPLWYLYGKTMVRLGVDAVHIGQVWNLFLASYPWASPHASGDPVEPSDVAGHKLEDKTVQQVGNCKRSGNVTDQKPLLRTMHEMGCSEHPEMALTVWTLRTTVVDRVIPFFAIFTLEASIQDLDFAEDNRSTGLRSSLVYDVPSRGVFGDLERFYRVTLDHLAYRTNSLLEACSGREDACTEVGESQETSLQADKFAECSCEQYVTDSLLWPVAVQYAMLFSEASRCGVSSVPSQPSSADEAMHGATKDSWSADQQLLDQMSRITSKLQLVHLLLLLCVVFRPRKRNPDAAVGGVNLWTVLRNSQRLTDALENRKPLALSSLQVVPAKSDQYYESEFQLTALTICVEALRKASCLNQRLLSENEVSDPRIHFPTPDQELLVLQPFIFVFSSVLTRLAEGKISNLELQAKLESLRDNVASLEAHSKGDIPWGSGGMPTSDSESSEKHAQQPSSSEDYRLILDVVRARREHRRRTRSTDGSESDSSERQVVHPSVHVSQWKMPTLLAQTAAPYVATPMQGEIPSTSTSTDLVKSIPMKHASNELQPALPCQPAAKTISPRLSAKRSPSVPLPPLQGTGRLLSPVSSSPLQSPCQSPLPQTSPRWTESAYEAATRVSWVGQQATMDSAQPDLAPPVPPAINLSPLPSPVLLDKERMKRQRCRSRSRSMTRSPPPEFSDEDASAEVEAKE